MFINYCIRDVFRMVDVLEIQKEIEVSRNKAIRKDIEFEWMFGSGFGSPSIFTSIIALKQEGVVVKDTNVEKWKFSCKKQI